MFSEYCYTNKEVGNLKISDVRIRFVKKEDSKLKAVASPRCSTPDSCLCGSGPWHVKDAQSPFPERQCPRSPKSSAATRGCKKSVAKALGLSLEALNEFAAKQTH